MARPARGGGPRGPDLHGACRVVLQDIRAVRAVGALAVRVITAHILAMVGRAGCIGERAEASHDLSPKQARELAGGADLDDR